MSALRLFLFFSIVNSFFLSLSDVLSYPCLRLNNWGHLKISVINVCNPPSSLVLKALWEKDLPLLREISNFFYRSNGIYFKACNTYGTLYRYDWYITPEVLDEKAKTEKILKEFSDICNFLDDSNIQKMCADIALDVIINGAYYGYLVDSEDKIVIQQLPIMLEILMEVGIC